MTAWRPYSQPGRQFRGEMRDESRVHGGEGLALRRRALQIDAEDGDWPGGSTERDPEPVASLRKWQRERHGAVIEAGGGAGGGPRAEQHEARFLRARLLRVLAPREQRLRLQFPPGHLPGPELPGRPASDPCPSSV